MKRATVLFGGYRRGDANDPETYVLSIAAVLSGYDEDLIREVTDPRTGISTQEKFRAFPPNSGELKEFCDGRAAYRARIQKYAELPKVDIPRLTSAVDVPGRRANVLVRSGAPQFAQMCERAKSGQADPADWKWDKDGIRVALSWLNSGRREIEPFRHLEAE